MSRSEPSVSSSVTEGVRVIVRGGYMPERSYPLVKRYVFVCSVRIENEGVQAAQLRSYHWIITSSMGDVVHLRSAGVAGKQPVLRPGEHFEYSSQCVLLTPRAPNMLAPVGFLRLSTVSRRCSSSKCRQHSSSSRLAIRPKALKSSVRQHVRRSSGELRGTYLLRRPNGRAVEAVISPFKLAPPYSVN